MALKTSNNPTDKAAQLLEMVQNTAVPPKQRAQAITYLVHELGLDTVSQGLEQLIVEADEGRQLKLKQEEEERTPLSPETFIGSIDEGLLPMAAITNGPTDIYLPCKPDEIEGLECGDSVLVDPRKGRIVGRNGQIPFVGDIASVESLPTELEDRVLLKHHERTTVARLPARLVGDKFRLKPGTRVIFDPIRRFVIDVVESESDGQELLAELGEIDRVSREELGAVHPVLEEMFHKVMQEIEHPEWAGLMRSRDVSSFLISGPTGTGKTMHVKVLARQVTDYVERLTGQRLSRLVVVDAATFYSSLFGQTEINIASFFDRLKRLGKLELKTLDGRLLKVPLIVVIEECEALLRNRGEQGGSSHLFDRPLSMMLQRFSSAGSELDFPCLFVMTSNHDSLIDPAARRRFGVRHYHLGSLSAGQARSVLEKKIHGDMPICGEIERDDVIRQVIGFLFGDEPDQGIAEVRLIDGNRRTLGRRDVVTGAMLEEAVSSAIDECLRESSRIGRLLGLDAVAVIRSLQKQYTSLASTLRPHNLREHCPDWFSDESIRVESVRPLTQSTRRSRMFALDG